MTNVSNIVMIEAQSFSNKGGWVVDQQFMDQMGSPYLMAHGLGAPVQDARTTVKVAEPGSYRVWIRNCNWTAGWSSSAAGKFECFINGILLSKIFGTGPEGWLWEDGGVVSVPAGEIDVRLHDLTGFNGRCDAILLSKDLNYEPPNSLVELNDLRRSVRSREDDAVKTVFCDLVVIGGGVAGVTCAISAARFGLKAVLINDRSVLGGNNSAEIGILPQGQLCLPPYPKVGVVARDVGVLKGRDPKSVRKLELVQAEKNVDCHQNMHLTDVLMEGNHIKSVTCEHIEEGFHLRFEAPLFVDCTGDGNLGYLAGADFRMGRESRTDHGEALAPDIADNMKNGTSNLWKAWEHNVEHEFPECPWAIQFTEDMFTPDFGDYVYDGFPCYWTNGHWFWQNGWEEDTVNDAEKIRDYNMLAAFGYWSFVKNRSARRSEYKNWKLGRLDYINGKRESRRLLGDHILTQQDVENETTHNDAFVYGTYMIDMHQPPEGSYFPHGEFLLGKHIHNKGNRDPNRTYEGHNMEPYPIPYRCLYSRNVSNLMMAGRCLSATHIGHSSARLINTTGMMGEVVAMGAALCIKHNCSPRTAGREHLSELTSMAENGVPWNV